MLILGYHSDGKTNGISMPNGEAHEALIRQAYDAIGLDLSATAMVEAHGKTYFLKIILHFFKNDIDHSSSSGTGTKVGDPIEAGAIGKCFGQNGIYLGAV